MRKRFAAIPVVVLVIGATLMLGGAPASAGVKFAKGTLTINGTGGNDNIGVDCSGNKVLVPAPTSVDCDKVKHIVINVEGGNDDVNLSLIFSPDFPLLTEVGTFGGPGYDELTGWPGRDVMYGEGDADDFFPSAGSDVFDGGPSWDRTNATCNCDMTFASGALTRVGVPGRSKLSSVEDLYLTGGAGANILDIGAWPGVSRIVGGDGGDTITGGADRDDIVPGSGVDTVNGGRGNDTVTVEESFNSADTLAGGPGSDKIYGGTFTATATLTDTSLTGFGADALSSFERAKIQRASAGTSSAVAFGGSVELVGSSGVDTLSGGAGDDLIAGLSGADTLDGNGGTDLLEGSTATGSTLTPTSMSSSSGTDTIADFESAYIGGSSGSAGTFNVSTFTGPVTISDSGGNDNIIGNGQTTAALGTLSPPMTASNASASGAGRTVTLSDVSRLLVGIEPSGTADLSGFTGRATVYGNVGDDTIKTGPRADFIVAGRGDDKVSAGAGRDKLYGGTGDDVLDGQSGRDGCNGDKGKNKLKSCEYELKPLLEK